MRQTKTKFIKLLGLGFPLSFIALFLFQYSGLVSANYQFEEYEGEIKSMTVENQTLGANLVEKNRFEQIEHLAETAAFEKTGQIRFIEITPAVVVSK